MPAKTKGDSLLIHEFTYSLFLGSRAIFLVVVGEGGGSSGEIKIVEGIKDAKNRSFVLHIALAGKSGGGATVPPAPPPAARLRLPCYSLVSVRLPLT